MPLYQIDDFSGGVTDAYLDGDAKSYQHCENLLIDEHRELTQRPGLSTWDTILAQIPAGNQAIDGHYVFDNTLFVKSGTRLYYAEADDTSWTTLDGPNAHAFADSEAGAQVSWSEWRGHLFITAGPTANKKAGSRTVKVFRNSSSVWTLYQAGLPETPTKSVVAPYITFSGGTAPGLPAVQYVMSWYVVFVHEYTAKVDGNNVTFKDYGKPQFLAQEEYDPIDSGNTATLHDDFDYTNGSEENYPTSTMAVETYRTEQNGYVPRFAVSDALGATIVDNVADAGLGAPLYIGDLRDPVLDNDPVPKAFFSDIIDSRMVYAGCEDVDAGEFNYDRIMESKPDDPDSVPAANYTRIEGKCAGLSHVGKYPISGSNNKLYRIEGHFDLFGKGGMRSVPISDSEGFVSQKGIIRQKDFILFPSLNGFCWSNGFQVVNLTETHLHDRYAQLLNKTNIAGAYNSKEKRAYWAVESPDQSPSGKNNELWVMDTRWSTQERAVFTMVAMTDDNLQANGLFYDEATQTLIVADSRGYVAAFDEDATTDIIIPTTGSLNTSNSLAIVTHFISSAVSAPESRLSIWATKIFGVFKNVSGGSLSLDFEGYDDDEATPYALLPARQRGITAGVHKIERWWRKTKLRSVFKQFGVKKGFINIVWSDDYDLASVSTDTVTIASGSWPTYGGYNLVGYYIYFDTDDYTTGYLITEQSGAALTLDSNPGDGSGLAWEIKGIPKNECTHIEELSLKFEILGEANRGYRASDVGGNA